MKGAVTIVCGMRGGGKTVFAQKVVKGSKVPYYAYDFHGDWNAPPVSMEAFIAACNKAKNSIFVFEDATSYCSQGSVKQVFRMALARSRGQGVSIFLIFHSLRLIPLDILEMANFLVLFKTLDNSDKISAKFQDFPKVLNAYNYLQTAPKYSNKIISL